MPEGIITKLTDRGFGFIKASDHAESYFFHANYMARGHKFASLQEGDAVEFKLRPSKNKPGQQEAFDVSAQLKTSGPDVTPESTVLPYGFVPIETHRAVTDPPVLHDGSSGGELLSGEILCELEALTPLLPGNARYKVEDADPQRLQQWGFGDLIEKSKSKQIAEPLRLPDDRVVIAGIALKGMIRHSLGALTSAPMERVGERHFTYRPNVDFNKFGLKERFVVRPALITAEREGGWDLEVFDDARAVQFVRHHAEPPPASRYRRAIYQGGIDGEGLLAKAFNPRSRTYRKAFVPHQVDYRLHLSAELYQDYLRDQTAILADNTIGHLTAHPGSKNFDSDQVSAAICQHAKFLPNQLIYVELTTDQNGRISSHSKIVSCGHHFRYRWAYTSSIRAQNGQPRACLTPLAAEQTDEKPERLSGARLLFGYVRDDKTNRIGEGVFTRLAGRIAINHAVSLGVPRFLGGPSTGYCVPLKILGQPKPSAWEFYLQQPDDLKKPMNTYGDLPGDLGGELAGRKFYRHQPGTKPSDLEAGDDEVIASDQATLARFICQPGTHFRFSIRFARLRDWELGALLAVLEPHHLVSGGKPDDYAHKLGLGRPLGMGSVRFTRQAIRLRQERDVEFMESTKAAKRVSQALQSVKIKLDQTPVQEWLAAHRWQEEQRLGYPESSDGTIYGWHTDIRKDYSRLRRQQDPDWSQLAQKIQRHH